MEELKKDRDRQLKAGIDNDSWYRRAKEECVQNAVAIWLSAASVMYMFGSCVIRMFGRKSAELIAVPALRHGLRIHELALKKKRGVNVEEYNLIKQLIIENTPELQQEVKQKEIDALIQKADKTLSDHEKITLEQERVASNPRPKAKVGKILSLIGAGTFLLGILMAFSGEEDALFSAFSFEIMITLPLLVLGTLFLMMKRSKEEIAKIIEQKEVRKQTLMEQRQVILEDIEKKKVELEQMKVSDEQYEGEF